MIRKIRFLSAALLSFAILYAQASQAADIVLEKAPISKAFAEYMENEAPIGYIPSPLDLSHLSGVDYSGYLENPARSANGRAAILPGKYDPRGLGLATPVKNQKLFGDCWAFAALGSLESTYLKRTGISLDLSEAHLVWFSYKSTPALSTPPSGSGGFDNTAVSTLARWIGPTSENALPNGETPSGGAGSYPTILHLEDAYFLGLEHLVTIDPEQYLKPNNDVRKRLIAEHGGISTGMYALGGSESARWPFYSSRNYAWYYNGAIRVPDHSVLLVGWDDDFPMTNFVSENRPTRNGAWLAKNSWGTDFGDGGFFWISYEDVCITDGVAYLAGASDNFDHNYGVDDLGWCASSSLGGGESWMSNVFRTGQSGETLQAVSFYATSPGAKYEIYVYSDLQDTSDPDSGTLAASASGTHEFAGYHTVRLQKPVYLNPGASFAVAVKLSTPGYAYPIPLETRIAGYSDNAVIERGISFLSLDGASWQDAADNSANVCLRAFTSNGRSSGPTVRASDILRISIAENGSVTVTPREGTPWTANAAAGEHVTIDFSPSDVESIVQDSKSIVITLVSDGLIPDGYNAGIRLAPNDGDVTAAFDAAVTSKGGRTIITVLDENRLWSGSYSVSIFGDPNSALGLSGTLSTDASYDSRDTPGGGCSSIYVTLCLVIAAGSLSMSRARARRR
ncbi:MAG: lectin like domain-containing protein [Synergistaceae bacterium]|jgi:C1A family cysteine protease|nr:lectin like domain-containing protein [Synergistaceae bacterium]